MGNCNQNFEDVGDLDYVEHFEVSNRMVSQPNLDPAPHQSHLMDQ